MLKKIISVILALCIAFGCVSVIASARSVGIGDGAESINPVVFRQEENIVGSERVSTNLVATITQAKYKVKINNISAKVLYNEPGNSSVIIVSYEAGTEVTAASEVKFPVTGDIHKSTNSAVRYTIEYDIINTTTGETEWKNLTGYTYGGVSGSTEVTGAIGTVPGNPGDVHAGARFTSIDKLNSCYVQVPEADLKYELKTQHFYFTFKERTTEVKVVDGNAPASLRPYTVDWPSVMWYWQDSSGTWLSWTKPDSGYYNFTIDMNANDADWDDDSNTVFSTEMYYLDDTDRNNAKAITNKILGVDVSIYDGYYVQKDKYTEDSWNNFLSALDMANQVIYAVPGANYGFKIACQNGVFADNNVTTAFSNLVEAPCDWTSHKDPQKGEEATCGGGGTVIYTCICGKTKTEKTDASACTPSDEWTTTIEPTCTTKGEEAQLCTMCQTPVNVREIEPLGHDYKETVIAPECEEDGYSIFTCTRCNNTYNDKCVEATGHTSGLELKENILNSTCTREGSYDLVTYCDVCGKEISRAKETEPLLPHTPGEWKVIKEATVYEYGIKALCCAVCDAQLIEEYGTIQIPKIPPYFKAIGSTVLDEERGIIYSLAPQPHKNLDGYVKYEGGEVEIIPAENGYGTGTTVNFVVEGEIKQSYKYVIFGDLTGDGYIKADDIAMYEDYINGNVTFEAGSAFEYATDFFFCEGVGDTYDLAMLYATLEDSDLTVIMQNPEDFEEYCETDKTLTGAVTVRTLLSEASVEKGDDITVTIKLTSKDYISNVQIPVLFDKTKFEIVGDATTGDFISYAIDSPFMDKNYVLDGYADKTIGFEKTSDDDSWNTDEAKAQYGYAYITATYKNTLGAETDGYAKSQDNGFVTFKLRALEDMDDTTGYVFVDTTWAKSTDNEDGLLVAGLKKSEAYDIYTYIVPYENVQFSAPSTETEAVQHNPGEVQRENEVAPTCTTEGSYEEFTICTHCGEEVTREKYIIPALGHTNGDTVIENEEDAVGSYNARYDEVVYCTVCGEEVSRETIIVEGSKGTFNITSFDDGIENSDNVTIKLFYEDELAYTFTATGSGEVSYEFTDVNQGWYTVEVSKANHVTYSTEIKVGKSERANKWSYTICLLGDVNGDGKVNTIDVARANSHAKKVSMLTGYTMSCADINSDGKVNTIDVARMNSHAKKVSYIWE